MGFSSQFCIPIYLQFSTLFVPYNDSKCYILYVSGYKKILFQSSQILLDLFISNGTAKTKLTILEFFSKCTRMAIMTVLASEALLYENKKFQKKNVTPVSIEPLDL